MKECNMNFNKSKCNCSYEPCDKKGICCDCIRYHLSIEQFPACFFSADVERTYNRSVKKFIETYEKRGKSW